MEEVHHLVSVDVATADGSELATLVAASGRVRAWLDAVDVRIAQRAAQLAAAGVAPCASDVVADGGRRSGREAGAVARRAGACDLLPDVHTALSNGDLSAGHVDAIARTAAALDDTGRSELAALQPALVAKAANSSVEAFSREMARLERILSGDDGLSKQQRNRRHRNVRRWVDRTTGMCHTHLQLDAETDAKVAAALDAAVAASKARHQDPDLTFDQLQADTLVELITRPDNAASSTDSRPVPEIIVLIDLATLRHGLHDHGVAETADGNPLPADTIRRMCCNADIIPVTLDTDGVAVDIGRQRRVATRHQRRALRAMHASCAYPGCTVRFDNCQIHHVKPWEHGGPTNLDNLLPLCSTHHHLVHEGRWTLTLTPDRTIVLRRPDRTIHYTGTTITRAPGGLSETPTHLQHAARRNQARAPAA